VEVGEADRAQLEAWLRTQSIAHVLATRAQIVLAARRARVSEPWRNGSRLPSERCVCGSDALQVMAWMVSGTDRGLGVHDRSPRPRSKR